MPREDVLTAIEELREDAVLPHPVRLRDMILKSKLDPSVAVEINREFQEYLSHFGQVQKIAGGILERIAASERKT